MIYAAFGLIAFFISFGVFICNTKLKTPRRPVVRMTDLQRRYALNSSRMRPRFPKVQA